jgi:hypothetical protein
MIAPSKQRALGDTGGLDGAVAIRALFVRWEFAIRSWDRLWRRGARGDRAGEGSLCIPDMDAHPSLVADHDSLRTVIRCAPSRVAC